jgi:hypothetical protein
MLISLWLKHEKGTDYVIVSTNDTNQLIPARLQSDLMDFNTYGLDQNGLFLITERKVLPTTTD